MTKLDLTKYGIEGVKEILHNPSYDELFAEETKPGLEGFEKGQVTELGVRQNIISSFWTKPAKTQYVVLRTNIKTTINL